MQRRGQRGWRGAQQVETRPGGELQRPLRLPPFAEPCASHQAGSGLGGAPHELGELSACRQLRGGGECVRRGRCALFEAGSCNRTFRFVCVLSLATPLPSSRQALLHYHPCRCSVLQGLVADVFSSLLGLVQGGGHCVARVGRVRRGASTGAARRVTLTTGRIPAHVGRPAA